jgi:diadenosine tetraphosphatase ApaH/serine/threonine PP2A family protein phosphatase
MRHLVLTDIHANLEALESCLADAAGRRYDDVLVLGDVVGYGADPNAVVERVRGLNAKALVRGNHDKVSCGLELADGFNAVARAAAYWTTEALSAENRQWVMALPRGPLAIDGEVEICHGSPIDEDEYIFGPAEARMALMASIRPLCLFGHTHYPAIFHGTNGVIEAARVVSGVEPAMVLVPGTKYLINPGAVGQPRDGDPRAAYAIVDTGAATVEMIRVSYPIAAAQEKIRRAGLPEPLADRLAIGR